MGQMKPTATEFSLAEPRRCVDSDLAEQAHLLFHQQKREWPLLGQNVAAMESIQVRSIDLGEFAMKVQFNPARLVSTAARVDATSIRQRKCFLCAENRPPEQRGIDFNGNYTVLANPFPIFPEHFTIPHRAHIPQRIAAAFGEMLDLCAGLSPRYAVFYNGPRCGASAPDHLHFQAGDRKWLPIESQYDRLKGEPIVRSSSLRLFAPASLRPFVSIETADRTAAIHAFDVLLAELATIAPAEEEPMMNVLVWHDANSSTPAAPGQWTILILPRARHRPSFYDADGDARILLSPGSVDLGGVCITPVQRDFDRLTPDHLRQMFEEVMLDPERFGVLRGALAPGN
jgi:hypothetical protein